MSKQPIPDLSRSEISHLIDEWIFNQRDRDILKRRLLDGVSFDQLSDEFFLSPQRIKAIVYKAQDKLYRHV